MQKPVGTLEPSKRRPNTDYRDFLTSSAGWCFRAEFNEENRIDLLCLYLWTKFYTHLKAFSRPLSRVSNSLLLPLPLSSSPFLNCCSHVADVRVWVLVACYRGEPLCKAQQKPAVAQKRARQLCQGLNFMHVSFPAFSPVWEQNTQGPESVCGPRVGAKKAGQPLSVQLLSLRQKISLNGESKSHIPFPLLP